jgi:hypothetical protein
MAIGLLTLCRTLRRRSLVNMLLLWGLIEAANFDPLDTAADQIVWNREADGIYSAKSAYLLQFDGCIESSFHKHVWQV